MKAHHPTTHRRPASGNEGYSLIELIVSMVIFSVGALGFASSSVVLERQVTMAAVDSDRSAAMATALERVRSFDFDSLQTGADSVGNYSMTWSVTQQGLYVKEVRVITHGPGMAPGAMGIAVNPSIADTFDYQVVKP